jgi:hypothetical protein
MNNKSWLIPPGTTTEYAAEIYEFVRVKELSLLCAGYVTCCQERFTHIRFSSNNNFPFSVPHNPPLMLALGLFGNYIAPLRLSNILPRTEIVHTPNEERIYRGWVVDPTNTSDFLLAGMLSPLDGQKKVCPSGIYDLSRFGVPVDDAVVVDFANFDSRWQSALARCWEGLSSEPTPDQLRMIEDYKSSVTPLILGEKEWVNYYTLTCRRVNMTHITTVPRRWGTTTVLAVCVAATLLMNSQLSVRVWFNHLRAEREFRERLKKALGADHLQRLSHHAGSSLRGCSANIDVFDGLYWPIRIGDEAQQL